MKKKEKYIYIYIYINIVRGRPFLIVQKGKKENAIINTPYKVIDKIKELSFKITRKIRGINYVDTL